MKMNGKSLRLVKDMRRGGQTPYHILPEGETEALCGRDCTGYTYSVFNPSEAPEATCDLCFQEYTDRIHESRKE